MSRRRFLAVGGTVAAAFATGTLSSCHLPSQRDFRVGACVSETSEEWLGRGIAFTDGHLTATDLTSLQRLWMAHGSSEVFVRIPTATSRSALDARCELARQVRLPLNPELILCSPYGDVARQPPPNFSQHPSIVLPGGKRWSQLTIDQIADALRQYGKLEARYILDRGVRVNVWDIGNEVEYGLAGVAIRPSGNWADGYEPPDGVNPNIGLQSQQDGFFGDLNWLQNELWPHVARMLAAVAEGIRCVDRHAKVATHCSTITPFLPGWLAAFHQAMLEGGFRADHLGASWYPGSNPAGGPLFEGFKTEAALARTTVGAPVYVAEYAYPAGPAIWDNPIDGYPVSPEGQHALLRDLTAWGAQTGNVSGIRPWNPDGVAGGWAGQALFELHGTRAVARPAVASMTDGLADAAVSPPPR